MQSLRFAIHANDERARIVGTILGRLGYEVVVLKDGDTVLASDVAVFTSEGRFRHRFLSVIARRFPDRNIIVPLWAEMTPLRVALKKATIIEGRNKEFIGAVENMAKWHSDLHKARTPRSFVEKLGDYLVPIFPSSSITGEVLVVLGCAPFNRPHTDVADVLIPRVGEAAENLAQLVRAGEFSEVIVVTIGPDALLHEALRRHFHPFMFMAVDEVELLLGRKFDELTRLWGRTHRRSDAEIAEALQAGASAVERQLIVPLRDGVQVPVRNVSWLGMLACYINDAYKLACSHADLLVGIYHERVTSRPSYAVLHKIDPTQGIERTIGNATLYIAEAMFLRDHPECIVANCEFAETYWLGLAPVLRKIWGTRTPYVGMINKSLRQPWGYGT